VKKADPTIDTEASIEKRGGDAAFNLAEIRRLVAEFSKHRPIVYWTDLSVSAAVGWTALVIGVRTDSIIVTVAAILIGAVAFLRAVLFIHEISHFRRGVMPGFTTVWNLLVGIPMALPSFMYVGTHTDHHKRHLYGTAKDPEYLPLARMGRGRIVRFVAEMFLVPILLVLRYLLLSPISWILPPFRKPVVERMSALVINPTYVRTDAETRDPRKWFILELAIFAWLAAWTYLIVRGFVSARVAWVWYATTATTAVINQIRTLAAHHYANAGDELTVAEQLLDSVNVRGWPIVTEFVFPVGLKYHALHHLIPDMPYHGLAPAHRKLMAGLPEGAIYRGTEAPGLFSVMAALWRRADRKSPAKG
jgi:fatty acid desaturase